jgi:hypothetical protein
MVQVIHAARFQRSALYSDMDSNISHSNECIIPILILCDIFKIDSASIHPAVVYAIFFANGSYFNLNAKPANPSLALGHNLMDLPPTCINSSHQHLISLPACFQAEVVVITEKERCHGCDKWFTQIEQHLMYHNHCQSVTVEHAC